MVLTLMLAWLSVDNSTSSAGTASLDQSQRNLQTLSLQRPARNSESAAVGGPAIDIVGEAAVVAPKSPDVGEDADLNGATANNKQASIYVVREGDTLGEVAEMFDVSVNTIKWANDIDGAINPDDVLVILPVSGVRHEIEEGDTLAEIVDTYDGDIEEVREYNELEGEDSLAVGAIIDIPGGTMPKTAQPSTSSSQPAVGPSGSAVTQRNTTSVRSGYFMHPAPGTVVTQKLHGRNGVDFGGPRGSSIMAAASGQVVKSVGGGWNGGYGQFVVVRHDNGTETLYSHLSGVIVSRGQRVVKGQVIGYLGNTGRSTGPHLHFEVHGTSNPFNACGLRTSCGS